MLGGDPWQLLCKQRWSAQLGSMLGLCLSLLLHPTALQCCASSSTPPRPTHIHMCILTPETAHDKAEPPIL